MPRWICRPRAFVNGVRMRHKWLIPLMVSMPSLMWGGSVKSLPFRSGVTPPACEIPAKYERYEQLFRNAVNTMSEAALIRTALTVGGQEMGLSLKQIQTLTSQVGRVYANIAADPAFAKLPSALGYGFSTTKPELGHYFLILPDVLPENPETIIFLHGFGGNLKIYPWLFSQEFPHAVVLVPSWGMSWEEGSPLYIEEMLKDASQRLGRPIRKPWLIGFSAGGSGGLRVYNQMPERFRGFVCLADVPSDLIDLRADLQMLILNGTEDNLLPLTISRQQVQALKSRLLHLTYKEIAGDHFFILSNRKATFDAIKVFMEN
jgi:predicted esterase